MNSPQLVRYSYLYKKKPGSRVFAPLANCYRKLGMFEEALNILREGIKANSDYTLGYIVLAKTHRDLGEFHKAYEVIKMASRIDSDNYSYKLLRADLAYKLGEAQDAYRLYLELAEIDPNHDYSKKIKSLESQIQSKKSKESPYFTDYKKSYENSATHQDDWVQMNFSETNNVKNIDVVDSSSDQDLVSMTLLNLYKEQGHYSKALKVANALLEQDPENEEVTFIRDQIIQARMFENEIINFEEDDELSEDHIEENKRAQHLNPSQNQDERVSELENYLKKFQEKLNLKSAQVQLKNHA